MAVIGLSLKKLDSGQGCVGGSQARAVRHCCKSTTESSGNSGPLKPCGKPVDLPSEYKALDLREASLSLSLSLLRFYLFVRDTGGGRSRLTAGTLMWDLIAGSRDHDLS